MTKTKQNEINEMEVSTSCTMTKDGREREDMKCRWKRKCSRGRKSEQRERREDRFLALRQAGQALYMSCLGSVSASCYSSCCFCFCSACCCCRFACCCCCCVYKFSVCFSYTFAAASRKGRQSRQFTFFLFFSVLFACVCYSCSASHRYTHRHTRYEVGVRTHSHSRSHTRACTHSFRNAAFNNFMHFSTVFIILRRYGCAQVSMSTFLCIFQCVYVCVCFDGIFMLVSVFYSYSAYFNSFRSTS